MQVVPGNEGQTVAHSADVESSSGQAQLEEKAE
jgi:hypothetical protein